MAHFDGQIKISPIPLMNKYQVSETISYVLDSGIRFSIYENFIFDGASIPKIFWIHILHPYDARIVRGALVHDYLYKHGNEIGITRRDADKIFNDIMKHDINKINSTIKRTILHCKRRIMYGVVRCVGFLFYKKKK